MAKVVLALDQASKTSGYAVYRDNKLETYGKFTYDDPDIDKRLVKIRQKVADLIAIFAPDEVVYEDIQQQNNIANNVATFKVLAEVYGVISELLESLGMKHSSVLAATWKSSLGIKGRTRPEQKKEAQEYVTRLYGIKPTQDECDAICIGLHHINQSANDWTE